MASGPSRWQTRRLAVRAARARDAAATASRGVAEPCSRTPAEAQAPSGANGTPGSEAVAALSSIAMALWYGTWQYERWLAGPRSMPEPHCDPGCGFAASPCAPLRVCPSCGAHFTTECCPCEEQRADGQTLGSRPPSGAPPSPAWLAPFFVGAASPGPPPSWVPVVPLPRSGGDGRIADEAEPAERVAALASKNLDGSVAPDADDSAVPCAGVSTTPRSPSFAVSATAKEVDAQASLRSPSPAVSTAVDDARIAPEDTAERRRLEHDDYIDVAVLASDGALAAEPADKSSTAVSEGAGLAAAGGAPAAAGAASAVGAAGLSAAGSLALLDKPPLLPATVPSSITTATAPASTTRAPAADGAQTPEVMKIPAGQRDAAPAAPSVALQPASSAATTALATDEVALVVAQAVAPAAAPAPASVHAPAQLARESRTHEEFPPAGWSLIYEIQEASGKSGAQYYHALDEMRDGNGCFFPNGLRCALRRVAVQDGVRMLHVRIEANNEVVWVAAEHCHPVVQQDSSTPTAACTADPGVGDPALVDCPAQRPTRGDQTTSLMPALRAALAVLQPPRLLHENINMKLVVACQACDQDDGGIISALDLRAALRDLDVNLTEMCVDELLVEADAYGDGLIRYLEAVRDDAYWLTLDFWHDLLRDNLS